MPESWVEKLKDIDRVNEVFGPDEARRVKRIAERYNTPLDFVQNVLSRSRWSVLKPVIYRAASVSALAGNPDQNSDNTTAFVRGATPAMFAVELIPKTDIKKLVAAKGLKLITDRVPSREDDRREDGVRLNRFSGNAYYRHQVFYGPLISMWEDSLAKGHEQREQLRRGTGFVLGITELVRIDMVNDPDLFVDMDWTQDFKIEG